MQLVANRKDGVIVQAERAERGIDHFCIECGEAVRKRGGLHRRDHFFHISPTKSCSSSGKGMVHLQIQSHIQQLIGSDEIELEKKFIEISRIADVCWEREKIVFEVQCSSISKEEIEKRNSDYKKMGYRVVWLLHERRYNKKRITPAEAELQKTAHYFTDIDASGRGFIYDQMSKIRGSKRVKWGKRVPVSLNLPKREERLREEKNSLCINRAGWPLYFSGDLIDLYLSGAFEESILESFRENSTCGWERLGPLYTFSAFYRKLFCFILERLCG